MFSICLMMFGVYAATNPSVNLSGQVSYSVHDARVLVQGKMYGADGYLTDVGYPAVTDVQNPGAKINTTNQYLDYTTGSGFGDAVDDFAPWNLGSDLKFFEDNVGIKTIQLSFSFTNLSNYPVKVKLVDNTTVNTNVSMTKSSESIILQNGTSGNSGELTISMNVIDDSKSANLTFDFEFEITKYQIELWTSEFYDSNNNSLRIVGYNGTGAETQVVIPATVQKEGVSYPVKAIGLAIDNESDVTGNEQPLFAPKVLSEGTFNTTLTNVIVSEGITEIGGGAFAGCQNLVGVTLPKNVTKIGLLSFAYTGLQRFEIPNTVTSVGISAFEGCSSLKTLVIPSSVSKIGDNAFTGCSALETISVEQEAVANVACGTNAFGSASDRTFKIYVPNIDYKTATNWSSYKDYMVVGKYIAVVSEQTIDHWKIQTYTDDTTAIIKYVGDLPEKDENGKINIVIPSSLVDKDGKTYQITSIGTRYEVFDIAGSGMELYDLLQYLSIFSDFDINHDDKDESYVYVNGTINITISEGIKSFNLIPFGRLKLGTVSIPSTINISDISSDMSTETILLSSFPFMISNIKEVKFASGIKKIPSVFSWLSEIDTVVIPASVEIIGAGAFESTGINNLSIESGSKLKTIEDAAFSAADGGYSTITNFVMPDTVETIGERAFYYREGLQTITLSKNLKTIGAGAFKECKALSSIDISSGVTAIEDDTFSGCIALTNVNIPSGVQSIGNEVFRGCSALTSIDIPSGVQSIGEYAFASCSALESIVVPKSVTSVGNQVFNECTSLKKVNLSPRVIYSNMFYSCPLEEVVLGEGVVEIKRLAFQDIQSITSISLPSSLQIVGDYAFSGCDGLKSESNLHGNAYYLGNETNPYVLLLSGKDSTITSCEINQMTKVIYNRAFGNFSSLESLTFAENSQLISIGGSAFSGCSALTSSLDIPNGVTTIGSYAFSGCSSLTSVTIPNSVTDIDTGVFSRCSGLKCNLYDNAYYLGNETNPYLLLLSGKDTSITSCTINQKTKFIHSDAFRDYYKSLTSVKFAENGQLISIGESAFQDCKSLTNISIPKSVKILRYYVFGGCPLKSVEIPDSVTSMSRAFYGCGDELTTVTIHAETPPAVDDNSIFGGCSNLVAIYVPAASVDAYKNADGWKYYADKIQAIS